MPDVIKIIWTLFIYRSFNKSKSTPYLFKFRMFATNNEWDRSVLYKAYDSKTNINICSGEYINHKKCVLVY